ncbi:tRNA lysidine(34) synthetase TilS [Lacibacter sediminis]|uniref:tRNA(Ile)-lysidine synthase n=1 Tax=Lacibacter sediminis TaxID=2760713 RepID=A0A7G5XLU3_9BACT|nr:tRNA lysidine(34) synthetase TilS [Lacibacter sediminis]QNA46446.1 tRNA lysidine(34) synthetase TilS [Lacibacter sediminis]
MQLLSRFQQYIQQHHLFQTKDQLLLAVSGGVDSVVLADLCHKAGNQFIIAHCNFQLRGEESDADELFVRSLGEKYKVEVLVKKFDTKEYAATNKLSIQEAARALRYMWFEELVNGQWSMVNGQSPGEAHHSSLITHLLTAHHADDNIETLLMNFFRGTGLHGLTGIPAANGHIKRPLLSFTKQELLDYATAEGLQFREDSSNQSSKYTRNFFRNEIIPAIEKVYPQVKTNLTDNINRFLEIEQLYKLSTQAIIKKLCRIKGKEIHIPVKQLLQYNNKALIYEIIHPYGFSEKQIDEVLKLAESDSGKYIDSPAFHYRIIKHRHWFIISPVQSAESVTLIIEENDERVLFEDGHLLCRKIDASKVDLNSSNTIALLDAKGITFPLLLRKWKTGDYFYPLGMKKKKKVARFLIDAKLSKPQKEKVWVLESNRKIIWVVGHRIDDRFKLIPSTKDVLQISYTV